MSTTPALNLPSFRISFESQLAGLPPEHQAAFRTVFNSLTDIYQAIPQLKSQIDSLKTSTSSSSSSTASASNGVTAAQAATIANAQALRAIALSLGKVNSQTTSYTAQPSDFGGIVSLNPSSTAMVTLPSAAVQAQYFTSLTNTGTGTTTIQPSSGLINGASSISLAPGQAATVYFDGTNWSATTSLPGTITGISAASGLSGGGSGGSVTLGIAASPALTGTPTAPTAAPLTDDTQIASTAYADAAVAVETSRAEASEAQLAPLASPTFTGVVTQPAPSVLTAATTATSATTGSASALPSLPLGFLEMSINGTTVKVPYYSV